MYTGANIECVVWRYVYSYWEEERLREGVQVIMESVCIDEEGNHLKGGGMCVCVCVIIVATPGEYSLT